LIHWNRFTSSFFVNFEFLRSQVAWLWKNHSLQFKISNNS
jgi:hypothetical protein